MSLVIFIVFMVFVAKPLAQFLTGFEEHRASEKRERELDMIRRNFMVEKERKVSPKEWESLSKKAVRVTVRSRYDR